MVKCLTGSKASIPPGTKVSIISKLFPCIKPFIHTENLCYGILFLAHILHHSPDLSCIAILGILDKLCENICAIVHTCLPEIAY